MCSAAAQLRLSFSESPKSSPDSESESADSLLNATPTESPPGSTLSPAGAVSGARVSPGPLPVAQGPCFAACGAKRKQPGQGGPEAACQCITARRDSEAPMAAGPGIWPREGGASLRRTWGGASPSSALGHPTGPNWKLASSSPPDPPRY